MTVFDFDKTIFRTDSTVAFWKYCVKRKKSLVFLLAKQAFWGVLYGLKLVKLKVFKEKFFCFMKHIDAEAWAKEFWEENESGIMPWAREAIREGDWVVSASPEFLLRPIAEKLGVQLIATVTDPATGKITGENCKGKEKIFRLAAVGVTEWDRSYSDSLSDTPILSVAKEGFLVDNKKGTIVPFQPRA
ncbi:MAG: HAD-IB family phosphatase [Christensenellaceae bacterium]